MPTTVERKIHFYAVEMKRQTPAGDFIRLDDPLPVFERIRELTPDYRAQDTMYMELGDGNDLLMQIDDVSTKVRGRFAVKRRTSLPSIERQGYYRPLRLAAEEGLAEIRHFVFYPETRILGIEVNAYGPHIGRWASYLMDKAGDIVNWVEPHIVLSRDVEQTLMRLGRITLAHIGVYRTRAAVIRQVDEGLHTGIETLLSTNTVEEVEIILKVDGRKRDRELDLGWLQRLARLLSRQGEVREALSKARVHAHDPRLGSIVPVNLLEDKLVALRQVVPLSDGSRNVSSDDMYRAIEDAYNQFRQELMGRAS